MIQPSAKSRTGWRVLGRLIDGFLDGQSLQVFVAVGFESRDRLSSNR